MDVLRPLGRSRLGLSCGIFGNGFALSADTLTRVPYTANSIVEDLEYHLHLIRAGIPVRFLSHASVFAEMPETAAAAVSQKARWEMGRTFMRRLWTPRLLRAVLAGKLHMLEPLIDLVALPLATQTALLTLALAGAFAAHLTWLGLYSGVGFFSVLLYLMVAASLSPEPAVALRALAGAPAFVLWKLIRVPRAGFASRTADTWVRTKRNAESADHPIR
jgi:cellulose synthase/poly-beta-1,6-N-acetylglucosamine synthase-like glycosyltransferase